MRIIKKPIITTIITALLIYTNNAYPMDEALFAAIKKNNIDAVNESLANGAHVNAIDESGHTPLMQAIMQSNPIITKILLDNKADANALHKDGLSTLVYAIAYNNIAVLTLLLENKANINAQHRYGMTPLMEAALRDNKPAIKVLLNNKADINTQNNNGVTSLELACMYNNTLAVEELLHKKAHINTQDNDSLTPLMWAAMRHGSKPIIEALLSNKADIHTKNKEGRTPIALACMHSNTSAIEALLNAKADVNAYDNNNYTVLRHALCCAAPTVEMLILAGANCDNVANDGLTLVDRARPEIKKAILTAQQKRAPLQKQVNETLFKAIQKNHINAVNESLLNGANINALDECHNRTPLMSAAIYGNTAIAKILIDKGAHINAANERERNQSALHMAAARNHTETVKLLLNHKADIHAIDSYGYTALARTISSPFYDLSTPETIEMLLSSDKCLIDEMANKHFNYTPLMCAVLFNNTTAAKLLLDKNANVHVVDKHNKTALRWAIDCQQDAHYCDSYNDCIANCAEIIELLILAGADCDNVADDGLTPLGHATPEMQEIMLTALQKRAAQIVQEKTAPQKIDEQPLEQKISDDTDDQDQNLASAALLRNDDIVQVQNDQVEMAMAAMLGKAGDSKDAPETILLQRQPNCKNSSPEEEKEEKNEGQKDDQDEEKNEQPQFSIDVPCKEKSRQPVMQAEQQSANDYKKQTNKHLLKAAINGVEKEVHEALLNGADINATDLIGKTPLMWAIFYEYTHVVNLLLNKGANTRTRDHYGNSPFSIAYKITDDKSRNEIIKILHKKNNNNAIDLDKIKQVKLRSLEKTIATVEEQARAQDNVGDEQEWLLVALEDCKQSLLDDL